MVNLDCIDLQKLKTAKGEERERLVAEYEETKLQLIQRYIELQDQIDNANEQVYQVTCQIEKINIILREIK